MRSRPRSSPTSPSAPPLAAASAARAPLDEGVGTVPPVSGAAVEVRGLGMTGPRGPVFEDVHLSAPAGSLIAVHGPSGSGRTCLLLALTGRMKPTRGRASVAGLPLPRRMASVRRVAAPAYVPGVLELEPALSVAEHLRERELLGGRLSGSAHLLPSRRRAARDRARTATTRAAALCGLDVAGLPHGADTRVRDLSRLDALRLSVVLALSGGPAMVAVDDADLKLSDGDRTRMWRMLRDVASTGTTVLAVCGEPPAPEDGGRSPGAAPAEVLVSTARGRAPSAVAPSEDGEVTGGPPRPRPPEARTGANPPTDHQTDEEWTGAPTETGRA